MPGSSATGTVKFFNATKGFGFIQQEGGSKDVFVHATALEAAGIRSLNEGDKVSFVLEDDRRGRGKQAGQIEKAKHLDKQDLGRERFRALPRGALSPRIKEVRMASHKYHVGEDVRFRPKHMSALMGPQDCKILRQLPAEDGAYLYRIKCVVENVERVAKEGELGLRPSMDVGNRS